MSDLSWNWPDWLPHLLWIRRKCPRCNSVKFKQAELRSFDGLLACLRCAPFAACFVGGDTTGLLCEARSEHLSCASSPAPCCTLP